MSSKSINRPLTHEEWYRRYFPRENVAPMGNRFDPGGPLNSLASVQKAQQDWSNYLASRNGLSTTSPLYDKTKSQFTSTALSGNTNTGTAEGTTGVKSNGLVDNAAMGLGAAVTMFDAYNNNAKVKDLSGIDDAMMRQATITPEASSREALVNQWNNLADIKDDYTYKDIRQNNTWDDVSNTLNSVGSGVMAGAQIGGPAGAIVGGVAGLGASIAGIFTGRDKAKKEAERLNNLANWANTSRVNNLEAGAQSLDATDALNAMRNYAAYGGILNSMKRYDDGGELSTHGSDFTNGARYINAGGTHEENPYEGVQMGTDSEGTPNLVEEGEVVYDDYVFSDRLKPSKTALKASNLPEKYEGLTFARIAEDLLSESKERPNDPISKDGAKVMLGRLRDVQEEQRSRLEERRMKRAIDNMSPEERQELVQGIANQMQAEQVPEDATNQPIEGDPMNMQQPAQPETLAMAEPSMAMDPAAQGATPMAEGGNLFSEGGDTKKKTKRSIGYDKKIKGDKFEAQQWYNNFLDFLKYINATQDETIKYKINGKEYESKYPRQTLMKEWSDFVQKAITDSGSSYKIKDFNDLIRLATDKKVGPVHKAVRDLMKNYRDAVRPELAKDDNWFKTNNLENSMRFVEADDAPKGLEFDNYKMAKDILYDWVKKKFKAAPNELPKFDKDFLNNMLERRRKGEKEALTHYLLYNQPKKEKKERPDYLRYAGVLGNLVGLAGNRLDYTEPEVFMAATANPRSVAFTPIGRYVNPTYMASEEYVTPIMNQINANRDTIVNNANGNSSAANAALIAAQNAGIGQIGAARLQGKQYNDQQRNAAIQSNRAVDQYNSQGSMQAQSANMNLNNYFYQRALANAQMRTAQKNAYDAANSANLTTLFDNLAGIGKERIAANMASNMGPYGYFLDMLTGRLGKKNTSNG